MTHSAEHFTEDLSNQSPVVLFSFPLSLIINDAINGIKTLSDAICFEIKTFVINYINPIRPCYVR